jgi:hypothetical protein
MLDQLLTYYLENHLRIIPINSESWGGNGCLARDRNLGNVNRWSYKGGRKREWDEQGNSFEGYRVLGPLCVLGCSSAVVLEGACVRDCRGL